jgi:hypothetical protein
MQRVGWLSSIVVTLIVGVIGGVLAAPYMGYVPRADYDALEREVTAKNAAIDRLHMDPVRPESHESAIDGELADARERIAALESRLAGRDAAEAEETLTEDAESTEETEDEDAPPTLDEIRERIAGNAQVNAQVKAITEMVYADFLNSVELEAAAKATLRDLLVQSQIEEAALEGYAVRAGDVTGRELQEWRDAERERLAVETQALLSQENYETFEQYQQNVDQRALEVTFDNQIRAFSSGLTPENHDIVIQVAVEEFMIERNALLGSDEIYTPRSPFEYQITAMDNMRQRLEPVMPEDQFRELDNWLRMGDNVIRQALESQDEDE